MELDPFFFFHFDYVYPLLPNTALLHKRNRGFVEWVVNYCVARVFHGVRFVFKDCIHAYPSIPCPLRVQVLDHFFTSITFTPKGKKGLAKVSFVWTKLNQWNVLVSNHSVGAGWLKCNSGYSSAGSSHHVLGFSSSPMVADACCLATPWPMAHVTCRAKSQCLKFTMAEVLQEHCLTMMLL